MNRMIVVFYRGNVEAVFTLHNRVLAFEFAVRFPNAIVAEVDCEISISTHGRERIDPE